MDSISNNDLVSEYRYALVCLRQFKRVFYGDTESLYYKDQEYWQEDFWKMHDVSTKLGHIEKVLEERLSELKEKK